MKKLLNIECFTFDPTEYNDSCTIMLACILEVCFAGMVIDPDQLILKLQVGQLEYDMQKPITMDGHDMYQMRLTKFANLNVENMEQQTVKSYSHFQACIENYILAMALQYYQSLRL